MRPTTRNVILKRAADFFVDNDNGNNANSGLTPPAAKLTMAGLVAAGYTLANKIIDWRGSAIRETYAPVSDVEIWLRGRILGSEQATGFNQTTIPAVAANLFDEGAESSAGNGYDVTAWQAASLGAGSTIDTNYTTTPIAGAQSVRHVKAATNCQQSNFLGTPRAVYYVVQTVEVESFSLPSSGNVLDYIQIGDGTNISARIGLQNISGAFRWRSSVRNNGADEANTNATPAVFAAGEKHKLFLKYDLTGLTAECKVENLATGVVTVLYSAALTGSLSGNTTRIRVGDNTNATTSTWKWDSLQASDTGYPSAAIVIPSNVWVSPQATKPKQVFLVSLAGAWSFGTEKLSLGALAAAGDYFWINDLLYLYTGGNTAGFDPDTLYSAVEMSVRASGITSHAARVKVRFLGSAKIQGVWADGVADNFMTSFGVYSAAAVLGDWDIYDPVVEDYGYKGDAVYATYPEWGDGIRLRGNSRIHRGRTKNGGRHNVAFLTLAGDSISNASVIGHLAEDAHHTAFDIQNAGGTMTGFIIRGCEGKTTTAFDTTRTHSAFFVQGQGVSQVTGGLIEYCKSNDYLDIGFHIAQNSQVTQRHNSAGNSKTIAGIQRGALIQGDTLTGNVVDDCAFEVTGNTTSHRGLDIDDMAKISSISRTAVHASGASGLAAQVGASSYTNAQHADYKTATGDTNSPTPADFLFAANLAPAAGSPLIGAGSGGSDIGA